ncbi:MAG: hypothetical protein HY534_06435 [Chloroflexi bacterium]|nr:hypothetical protein [Chloroflexota bacterium]
MDETFRRLTTTIPDNPDWRRHRGACPNYRERWSAESEPGDDGCRLLYQVICLMNTPPLTIEEQQRCLCTTGGCWRGPETCVDSSHARTGLGVLS